MKRVGLGCKFKSLSGKLLRSVFIFIKKKFKIYKKISIIDYHLIGAKSALRL